MTIQNDLLTLDIYQNYSLVEAFYRFRKISNKKSDLIFQNDNVSLVPTSIQTVMVLFLIFTYVLLVNFEITVSL